MSSRSFWSCLGVIGWGNYKCYLPESVAIEFFTELNILFGSFILFWYILLRSLLYSLDSMESLRLYLVKSNIPLVIYRLLAVTDELITFSLSLLICCLLHPGNDPFLKSKLFDLPPDLGVFLAFDALLRLH